MNPVAPFILVAGASIALTGAQSARLPRLRHSIAVIGHRAGAAIAPENTLAAIRSAIRLGADYVELDIRTTRDGAFVIMHDSTVDRTTNGSGRVRDLTLEQIRALQVRTAAAYGAPGERVPTFEEALAACRGHVNLYLDHKDADTEALISLLRKHHMERNVLVYNGPAELAAWKRLAPRIPVMPSLPARFRRAGGVRDFEAECPAEALDGHLSEWTRDLVEQAHASGIKVYVDIMGPTDNADGYSRAIEMGVDGIQTDRPDELIRFLAAHHPRR